MISARVMGPPTRRMQDRTLPWEKSRVSALGVDMDAPLSVRD